MTNAAAEFFVSSIGLCDGSPDLHGGRACRAVSTEANVETCSVTGAIDGESFVIGEALLQSILLEVSCHPKPGLVTPLSTGAHDDMNLQTFMLSSAAIAPCFYKCAQLGRQHAGDLPGLLSQIRTIGVIYENHLLSVTNQVNTQRGILFSASVLCAAAGYLSQRSDSLSYEQLSRTTAEICRDLCDRDFEQLKYRKPNTAGEILFERYGAKGVRGEAESGFATVVQIGLPALENALGQKLEIRHALVQCLLALMSVCEDTTVLWRTDRKELVTLQHKAREVLEQGGVLTQCGQQLLADLEAHCIKRRISPGGSADLLALTTGFYLLRNKGFGVAVL